MQNARPGRIKKDQSLTQEGFDRLLDSLDADRDRAAARYEELRRALIAFFSFRQSPDPFEHTDETFSRVARRLGEGQNITSADPAGYFYAIARNVWREHLAKPYVMVELSLEPSQQTLPGRVPKTAPAPDALLAEREAREAEDAQLRRLDHCLEALAFADRTLLIAYYEDSDGNQITRRESLAREYGLTVPSLRNRLCRLREKLAACLRNL